MPVAMRALSCLALIASALAALVAACSSSSASSTAAVVQDESCAGPCPVSKIKHLVVLIQENHTFDDHLGGWCKAPSGSSPTCTKGPACCEAMPPTDPKGTKPTVLTDAEHAAYDPPHDSTCETAMMNGGKMDSYATAMVSGESCGNPKNVASSDPSIIAPFWALASAGAVADRYFQPVVGQSYANDMFFARAQYIFADDTVAPKGAVGVTCGVESTQETLTGTTIGDLLTSAHVPWTFFAEGYAAMKAADGGCPPRPSDCPFPFPFDPCGFEPSDVPFEYYASTRDGPATMKDYSALQDALANGGLPAVSFVKALEYKTEHPGENVTASAGVAFVASLAQQVAASRYASDTLLLVTYDEGGGYFDHVTPPGPSPVDHQAYGTRIPLVAVGPFAATGTVSHVVMEHSSIVKFIEWNFLGGSTGQLQGRDAVVANLGSLLDPSVTGVSVPQQ
jgi:phospholipase C